MTRPMRHAASRLTLMIVLCIGFIGAALLLSHAHLHRIQQPTNTPAAYQSDLPPLW
jgi:hypothetical protein